MKTMNTPVRASVVDKVLSECGLDDVGKASIRETVKIVNLIEAETGVSFVRMEMGVPGLPASSVGIQAEIESLKNGVASVYPSIEGIPELKEEASRFVKKFVNIEVAPLGCIPVSGSTQGSMAVFMTVGRCRPERDHILFIDPGFPVHKQQVNILGMKYKSFDVYSYRSDALRTKLESYLQEGNISAILYSSPNNPSWICLTEKELAIIGELSQKYDVTIIEDLAYFGMDFRMDYGVSGQAPFQPTVARYTDNYVLMFSASKIFSYAGQRIGFLAVSDQLFYRNFPNLKNYFTSEAFGHFIPYGALYALAAGTTHSAQCALAAMLKAASDGKINLLKEVQEYGFRAKVMKELFQRYGFKIVYDRDENLPLADGFYFTIAYPGFTGSQLIRELLYYGISAITLDITGSDRTEGLRACVSFARREQFPDLEDRLRCFQQNHPIEVAPV